MTAAALSFDTGGITKVLGPTGIYVDEEADILASRNRLSKPDFLRRVFAYLAKTPAPTAEEIAAPKDGIPWATPASDEDARAYRTQTQQAAYAARKATYDTFAIALANIFEVKELENNAIRPLAESLFTLDYRRDYTIAESQGERRLELISSHSVQSTAIVTRDSVSGHDNISAQDAFDRVVLMAMNPRAKEKGVKIFGTEKDCALLTLAAIDAGLTLTNAVDIDTIDQKTKEEWTMFKNALTATTGLSFPATAVASAQDAGQEEDTLASGSMPFTPNAGRATPGMDVLNLSSETFDDDYTGDVPSPKPSKPQVPAPSPS